MCDAHVDSGARRNVPALAHLDTNHRTLLYRLATSQTSYDLHECHGIEDTGILTVDTHLVFLVGAEEARVVALLDDDEGDAGLVADLQLHARLAQRPQLLRQHLQHKTSD